MEPGRLWNSYIRGAAPASHSYAIRAQFHLQCSIGGFDVGRSLSRRWADRLCDLLRLRRALRADLAMTLDFALGALVTAILVVYLVVALVRPEKF